MPEEALSIRPQDITNMAREYWRHHAVGVVMPGYVSDSEEEEAG